MKFYFKPVEYKIAAVFQFLLLWSLYIIYCNKNQVSALYLNNAVSFIYENKVLFFLFATSSLFFLKTSSFSLNSYSFINLLIYINHFSYKNPLSNKPYLFYLLLVLTIIFIMHLNLSSEFKKSFYMINFTKKWMKVSNARHLNLLGQEGNKIGSIIYWDNFGCIAHEEEITKKDELKVEINDIFYQVPVKPFAYCSDSKLIAYKFLYVKKDLNALELIYKLERMGWSPLKMN